MHKLYLLILLLIVLLGLVVVVIVKKPLNQGSNIVAEPLNPLTISAMREKVYPGSDLKIEQTLADGSNYHQYIASYLSDGLKIYGLLMI